MTLETAEFPEMYSKYQKYFHEMSPKLLPVWIEVAERRLPNYRRWDDIVSVKTGLLAAKSVQRYRNAINGG